MPSEFSASIRATLYADGVRRATAFLRKNKIPIPEFFTYNEADAHKFKGEARYAYRLLLLVRYGNLQGTLTGLYTHGHVFVNVPVTALPVYKPQFRSWSYPGWKTDRTAMGVVAHEVGHYVERCLQAQKILSPITHGPAWRDLIKGRKVSGYEPVPSEAWAESLRLFILNPDLLLCAIPKRYTFIRQFLQPSETRPWKEVLVNHPAYVAAGERWINAR